VQFAFFLTIFFLAEFQRDLRIDITAIGAGYMGEFCLTALAANGIINSL
jgi:hypothetical protein